MDVIFYISGFSEYFFKNKELYRKSYIVKMKNKNLQFRGERKINRSYNNSIEGYILYREGKRKFYSLERLRHRIIKGK